MIEYAYVDMDGVLSDFITAACKAHGRDNPYPEHRGKYDMADIWGISATEFWKPTDNEAFWANMPKLPGANDVISRVVQRVGSASKVFIATSASASKHSLSGKKAWIEKWFPALKSRVITIKDKWMLSRPNRLLVDDTEGKCADWRNPPDGSEGGPAVWYPAPHSFAPEGNHLLI